MKSLNLSNWEDHELQVRPQKMSVLGVFFPSLVRRPRCGIGASSFSPLRLQLSHFCLLGWDGAQKAFNSGSEKSDLSS